MADQSLHPPSTYSNRPDSAFLGRASRAQAWRFSTRLSSDQWVFYPRSHAPLTLATDLEWREISGEGTLVHVHHRPASNRAGLRRRGTADHRRC